MIPEEARQCIGRVDPPQVMEVERGSIRRYAEAVGDDNPLYRDEEHARKSRYRGIIAPPGFFGWPIGSLAGSQGMSDVMQALSKAGFPRILDGGMSYEFYQPILAGDTLVASPMVKEITEKESKSGNMVIFVTETTYMNQNGDTVARKYHTIIAR